MPARYSRDTAVSAIRSFYQFFATLPTLPPEYIWEPPSGGWPEINSISLGHLGHNKDVIDLLRHIPYINDTQIAFQTTAIDYASDAMKWCLDKNAAQQGSIVPYAAGVIPEHVAVLTDGGRYGSWLLLDTRAGTVTDFNLMGPPEQDYPPRGHPEHWRAYLTLPIHEFFEDWKQQLRSLAWVVVPEEDQSVLCDNEASTNEIRDIYREHGWPYSFRFEDCKAALLRWKEDRFKTRRGSTVARHYYP